MHQFCGAICSLGVLCIHVPCMQLFLGNSYPNGPQRPQWTLACAVPECTIHTPCMILSWLRSFSGISVLTSCQLIQLVGSSLRGPPLLWVHQYPMSDVFLSGWWPRSDLYTFFVVFVTKCLLHCNIITLGDLIILCTIFTWCNRVQGKRK